MKKILTAFSFAMLGVAAMAQETYDNAQLATKDLNGTARYVGMGGAMEALGADITTMNTNPAGVGLFRRSMITGSFGFNSLSGTKDIGKDKTKASFDHVGFVYVMRSGRHSMLNFGFNYTKSKNFSGGILSFIYRTDGNSGIGKILRRIIGRDIRIQFFKMSGIRKYCLAGFLHCFFFLQTDGFLGKFIDKSK